MKKLNDLSQLKGLIQNIPAEEKKAPQVKKTMSREKIHQPRTTSPETASEPLIHLGSRIVLMDCEIHGVVVAVHGSKATVETDDGLRMQYKISELVPSNLLEEKALMNSVTSRKKADAVQLHKANFQKSITVDLHIEAIPGGREVPEKERLEFQLKYFRQILRENRCHKGFKIIFVHGVGDGILKNAIRRELDEVYALSCKYTYHHSGATTVTF